MLNSLYFNGKDSYKDLELLFLETPSIPLSTEEAENILIDGLSGHLQED